MDKRTCYVRSTFHSLPNKLHKHSFFFIETDGKTAINSYCIRGRRPRENRDLMMKTCSKQSSQKKKINNNKKKRLLLSSHDSLVSNGEFYGLLHPLPKSKSISPNVKESCKKT